MAISDVRHDAAWQAANPDAVARAIAMAQDGAARRELDPAGALGYRRQLEARAGHDTYDRIAALTMPVFLAGGRYDRQAPPENMQVLRDRIPAARLELFEGGHGFTREDPRAYQRIIAFLRGELVTA
jgi:3-oxoadipate enol-lactonase